jgi:hypothetical protein
MMLPPEDDRMRKSQEISSGDSKDKLQIASSVHSVLVKAGMDDRRAWSYGAFCQDVYGYIQNDPQLQQALKGYKYLKDSKDVFDGTVKVTKAENYLQNARALGLTSAETGFRNFRGSGAADVLSVFVDRFEALAKRQGIELNECSLAVTKVALSVATAGAGALTSLTPMGWVLLGIGTVSTFKESYALGIACFS